ncbi:MAG TPA: hypothetical protein VH496_12110 [Mycobacterium sp.]
MTTSSDVLTPDISDVDLELASGLTVVAQAGASNWSTIQVSGCTCIG